MKIKNILAKALILCICAISLSTVAFANVPSDPDTTAEPYAISTTYYHKTINGKCMRRLWDVRNGVWIDPYWTVCPDATHNHDH